MSNIKKIMALLLSFACLFCMSAVIAAFADGEETSVQYAAKDTTCVQRVGDGWSESGDTVYTSGVNGNTSKYLLFRFNGEGVEINVSYGGDKGSYEFYIDGIMQAGVYTADINSSDSLFTTSGEHTIFTNKTLSVGNHVLKVLPTGGNYAKICRFTVYKGAEGDYEQVSFKADDADRVARIGGWSVSGSHSAYTSAGAGKYLLVNFSGVGIDANVAYANDKGEYEFYIDDVLQPGVYTAKTSVDESFFTVNGEHTIFSARGLSSGDHVLKVQTKSGWAEVCGFTVYSEKGAALVEETYIAKDKTYVERVGDGWSESGDTVYTSGVNGNTSKYLLFKFYGVGVDVNVSYGEDKGAYEFYIDGVKQEGVYTADINSADTLYTGSGEHTIFTDKKLASGMHVIKVLPVSGSYAQICRFTVYRTQDTAKHIINGIDVPHSGWAESGTSVWGGLNSDGKTLEVSFFGKGVMPIIQYGSDRGEYSCAVDGEDMGVVNANNGSAYNAAIYAIGLDTDGQHTLTLTAHGSTEKSLYATVIGFEVYTETVLYTVTFENYGSVTVGEGLLVAQPETPVKEATVSTVYTFDGWYNGETKWDFESDTVTGDITLVQLSGQAGARHHGGGRGGRTFR